MPTARPDEIELKNRGVASEHQGTGVGRALVAAAIERCRAEGRKRMLVGTAGADTGDLRFYQRRGFRLLSAERDAFMPATGYPEPMVIDGIPLLDRLRLSQEFSQPRRWAAGARGRAASSR